MADVGYRRCMLRKVFAVALVVLAPCLVAGELTEASDKFMKSVKEGDAQALKGMAIDSSAREEWLTGFKQAAAGIKAGKLKLDMDSRELVIDKIGAKMMCMEAQGGEWRNFVAVIWVKEADEWKLVPWEREEHLREFAKARSAEEQIHLKLIDEWEGLMEDLIRKEKGLLGVNELDNVSWAKSDLEALKMALTQYKTLSGDYPTTEQGLNALVAKPDKPPLPKKYAPVLNELSKDPWGRLYQYENVDGKVRLWSQGPDAEEDKDDVELKLN